MNISIVPDNHHDNNNQGVIHKNESSTDIDSPRSDDAYDSGELQQVRRSRVT